MTKRVFNKIEDVAFHITIAFMIYVAVFFYKIGQNSRMATTFYNEATECFERQEIGKGEDLMKLADSLRMAIPFNPFK